MYSTRNGTKEKEDATCEEYPKNAMPKNPDTVVVCVWENNPSVRRPPSPLKITAFAPVQPNMLITKNPYYAL